MVVVVAPRCWRGGGGGGASGAGAGVDASADARWLAGPVLMPSIDISNWNLEACLYRIGI
jgi:hypothetical protein